MPASGSSEPTISIPSVPVLVLGALKAVWLSDDGEIDTIDFSDAAARLKTGPAILVDTASTARRLAIKGDVAALDILELFAFVLPAQFCLPTARGVAAALGLGRPESLEDQALILLDAVQFLLNHLSKQRNSATVDLASLAAGAGWNWGQAVLRALGTVAKPPGIQPLAIWLRLPEWEESAPLPPPSQFSVDPSEARRRLADMLRRPHGESRHPEARPQQADYASSITPSFGPRAVANAPNVVLAEAGTGVGKTLGYLAPASLWAERNHGAVWISTFTRNLQNQIDDELDRLYPNHTVKRDRVVVRKGRENYFCLLNYEDAARIAITRTDQIPALVLVARWASFTRDGALVGGDFPGWLAEIVGRPFSLGLADRRGECVYSACPHYSRCYIEHGIRRARNADIVIANHALVMVQAALGGLDDTNLPTRYVFDEGHQLFDAADSAFAAHLSGAATAELRRWILGVENGPGRARGLRRRIEDLLTDEKSAEDLLSLMVAAAVLPSEGWGQRLTHAEPYGTIERFLALVYAQVAARVPNSDSPYDIEADRHPLSEGIADAAISAEMALKALQAPIKRLLTYLETRLDDEADEMEKSLRTRIEAMIRSLTRRGLMPLTAWCDMLNQLPHQTPERMVDWFAITRSDGRNVDVGLHRHWIDPSIPFAATVLGPAHGAVITSATLTDGLASAAGAWNAAEQRTGAAHLTMPAIRAHVPSPFDYATQTRALVVTDVRKDDLDQVAAAYRALFLASGGGGLGLFTAISRLKSVRDRILAPLDAAGVSLLAQHIDGLDVGTLIDIFRAEEDACLLGTDAVRDGVDVPGRSLRLIVFDRVPWPRPSILHRVRREAFGGKAFDDMLTRLRLRQAFGRLIRRATDTGVFVLLDPMMPTRLASFLPEGIELRRVGLAEAVAETKEFLKQAPGVRP